MIKKIGLAIIAIIVIMQFFRIDTVNPEVVIANDFISITKPDAKTKKLLKETCYDCHSNETRYPWYANVAPFSWWIKDHIDDAKRHLNFSEWANYSEDEQLHKLHESYEEVEHGRMPLEDYIKMHDVADLSDEDREHLEGWIKDFFPYEDAD